jgi:hypothetical protein
VTDTETPAETLRRAAEDLGRQAERAAHKFRDVMLEPSAANAFADTLRALAADMDDYPAVLLPDGGVGIESRPGQPSALWTAAHDAARCHLGEATP